MKTISRYIMTLALLLTAVTGAWATDEVLLTTINASSDFQSGSKTFDNKVTVTFSNEVAFIADNGWCAVAAGNKTLTVEPVDGVTITRVKFYTTLGNAEDITAPFEAIMNSSYVYVSGNPQNCFHVSVNGSRIGAEDTHNYLQKIEVYGTAEAPLAVAWNAANKTGTFAMPGSDVVLTPQYAPTAKWDVVETVPQQPAALEGIIAGQDAAIVTAGQSAQGTVMYAVGTSATEAPALTDFSATVPTAKTYDDATTVYVWYYIQGHDTPDGQQATEENTFNDSEISATPLKVDILTNKFDITLNPANANTIEAGKATVTVDGQSATVTDGKLQGVKMGSEVKLEANPGYKFRKVEVKKKAAAVRPLAEATAEDLGKIAGADGNIYDTKAAAEAAGTTAVAMIAYVGSSTEHATYTHGMALALSDEGEMNWSNAKSTCEGKSAVSGAAWLLPSRNQWKAMFKANGGNEGNYTGLNTAVATAGGDSSKLQKNERYWSSSEQGSNFAWVLVLGEDSAGWDGAPEDLGHHVRACLAF